MSIIIGTNGADTLVGTSSGDLIIGGNGDDTLSGENGNDIMLGGSGDDSLAGGNGNDVLTGGEGDDAVDGGDGTDTTIYLRQLSSYLFVQLSDGAIRVTDIDSGDTDVVRNVEFFVFTDAIRAASDLPFSAVVTANGQGGVDIQLNNVAVLDESLGTAGVDNVTYGGADDVVLPANIENITLTGAANVSVTGNAADNTLIGNAGNNTLNGGDGSDVVDGGAGDDTLIGGAGIDTVVYSSAVNPITVDLAAGTASGIDIGNDTLIGIENVEGGLGDDTIRGDAGANRLVGGGGNDLLDGGGGSDTAGYALATQAVLVDLQAGTASGIDVGNDTLISIENVDGGFGNDNILGDASANRLVGGDGNDRLAGRGGDDVLDGGAGIDTAGYAGATQTIVIDLQAGTAGGQAGNDTLISMENADGGSGNDTFLGDAGANRLAGAAGNDRLTGRGGDDVLDGGTGSDTAGYAETTQGIFVDLAAGTASGVEIGTDTLISIENADGGSGNDDIRGGAGANQLVGAAGDDTLSGGQGADRFVYESGADTVLDFNRDEGDRINLTNVPGVLSLADVQAAITDPLAADTVLDFGGGNTLTLTGVAPASLVDSDFMFAIIGDDDDNTLVGTAGIDVIRALGGDDTLQGLAGDDVLDGGSGVDRAVFSESTGGIVVDLAAGTASGASIGNDTLISIEDVVGGSGSDSLLGSAGRNVLLGGAGPDALVGRGGDDLLDGGASNDIASFAENRQSVFVDLAAGTASGIESGNDTLVNIESVAGGSGNDVILGNAGANQLIGVDGDDRLVGRGGNDRLEGGAGSDTTDYAEATQSVFVDLTAGTASGVEIGTDTLIGIENVDGGSGDDSIRGDAGSNRLLGASGADQLEGRGGGDHFVYNATIDGLDHITDFSGHDGEGDVFDFSALAFGNGLAEGGADTGVLDASHFVANDTGATTADEVFWYNTSDSTLYYDADGNGSGEAVAIAALDNGFVLTNTDLHLI